MFSNADQEAILRFIFSREANVELALGVLAAGPSIREKIIQDFLTSLEAELGRKTSQLGASWRVVNELKTDPFMRQAPVYMTKQDWNNLYKISLSPDNWGARGFFLGVWSNEDTLASGWTVADQRSSARVCPKWHKRELVALLDVGRPLSTLG